MLNFCFLICDIKFYFQTSAIAMEEFIISKENFNGLTCVWGRDKGAPTIMNSLMCYVYNNLTLPENKVLKLMLLKFIYKLCELHSLIKEDVQLLPVNLVW